jgi:hypothetical protein
MALAHCILGKFLGVGCHCFPPPLVVPTFSARCLHVQLRERPLAAEGGTLRGREMLRQISSRIRLLCNSRDLLHAANLRHGTDGFTFPPKEGVLKIFSPLKIRRLRPGLNPRTWVPKASTLPLDHRSRLYTITLQIMTPSLSIQSATLNPSKYASYTSLNPSITSSNCLYDFKILRLMALGYYFKTKYPSIPLVSLEFFYWHNPSGHPMALGST